MLSIRPTSRVIEILHRNNPENGVESITSSLKKKITKEVIRMGLPSMASFMLMTVYDLTDTFWLAKLGPEPVAAVTVFGALIWILTFPNQVIGAGSVAIISRRFGAGDLAMTERAIKGTFVSKFAVGTGLGLIGLLITPWMMVLLGAEPDVAKLAVDYGIIQCIVLGFQLASFSVYTALRGIGRPAAGMWISVAGTIVNVVMDPLLIFGIGPFPEMGIVGASIASALGFITVCAVGMIALSRKDSPLQVNWFGGVKPNVPEMVKMFRIGFPAGLNSLSFALMMSVRVKLFALYGTNAVALYGMSMKIMRVGVMVIVGLGLGTGALIGQYLGAKKLNHAWVSAMSAVQLAAGSMLVVAVVLIIFAPQVVKVFFSDPELLIPGIFYLKMMAIGLPLVGVIIQAENAYSGAGMNVPPMIIGMTIDWGMIIPIMYVAGVTLNYGPDGMLVGWVIALTLGALVLLAAVRRGSWLEHNV
ncbi:MATE family efflux transporter [bacterium]|nr:MAG: MATE family efflux transporter [bacterium]